MVEECRRICESCYHANWDCEGSSLDGGSGHYTFDGCDKCGRTYYDPFDKEWKCKDYKELQPLHLE